MDPRDEAIAARLGLDAATVAAARKQGPGHPQWEAVREAMLEASRHTSPSQEARALAESHARGHRFTAGE